jgi:hypothetical protein
LDSGKRGGRRPEQEGMGRRAGALLGIAVLALLLTGCQGGAFIPYGDSDGAGAVAGKTLGNVGLAALYVTAELFYAAAEVAAAFR